jgi:preprotein translocase subunit SecA
MTATAQAAENEFKQFYGLDIVVIPPHSPCIRNDQNDMIFLDKKSKFEKLVFEISRSHDSGQPVLVGTGSIRESSMLAELLSNKNIGCRVLNAKNDEHEAEIISQAGKLNSVTISTNMAGRGTDIKLGGGDEDEKKMVAALDGLYVIGTNKHESIRIDNQLKGRAGRQGDPGSSKFFVSLEDDLFVKYRMMDLFPKSLVDNLQESDIENPIMQKEINRVQRIIEGQNLEIKKTLYKYSSLIEQQRKIVFRKRDKILNDKIAGEFFMSRSKLKFESLASNISLEKIIEICRFIALYHIDKFWSQFLSEINYLREGIHLNRFAGQDPFFVYQKISIELFDKLFADSEIEMVNSFERIENKNGSINLVDENIKAPSSTWTYLINDNPLEDSFGAQLMGSKVLIVGGGMEGILLLLYPLIKKFNKRKNRR